MSTTSTDFMPATPEKVQFDLNRPLDVSVLAGKTAIVTGGASGIGLGIATALAENGAYVAILDLNEENGREAEMGLKEKGCKVKFIRTDVTSWESQLNAFKEVLEWSGRKLDIVVTSAGVASANIKHVWIPKEGEEDVEADPKPPTCPSIQVNMLGTYNSVHLALTYFARLAKTKEKDSPLQDTETSTFRPQLLLISSLAGYFEQQFNPDYCGSKHGVRGIWKGIRSTSKHFGNFQTNLLAPTFISSPMISQFEDMLKWRGALIGDVGDVVQGALRCICDGEVQGRAICCVKREKEAGDRNFDVGDDVDGEGLNGGTAMVGALRGGLFGKVHDNAR